MNFVMKLVRSAFLLVTYICFANASTAPITIENHGYSGITVAIHQRVPENAEILKGIEELFKLGSPVLYTATRNRAFFKEVTIAIPSTWKHKPHYENVTGDFFSEAHIRVDFENPQYGDDPYTLQPEGCGQPGLYIHYTPGYVTNPDVVTKLGNVEKPGHRLVKEWSHFRYGVFDEFGYKGDKKYPTFYIDSEKAIAPNACTKGFTAQPNLDENCFPSITEGDSLVSEFQNCSVLLHDSSTEIASIMFTASLDDVQHYCDSEDKDNGKFHNANAPNKQNHFCAFKSTWEVVSSHPDISNAPQGSKDLDTSPTFRYIRTPSFGENRFVWVLDTSHSMKGRPIQLLKDASSRCIMDHQCITDNSEIGLIAFDTHAHELSPLVKVKTELNRNMLVSCLPRRESVGYTGIGEGLEKAIELLSKDGKSAEGGRIILVTDGEENQPPLIKDTIPKLIQERVSVSAIAFGHKASEKLENLTTSTGGKLHLFSNIDGSSFGSSLDFAFLEATTTQIDVDIQPVTIANGRLEPTRDQSVIRPIYIEKTLGKNTDIILYSTHSRQLEAILVRPNGTEITQPETIKQGLRFSIPIAENGLWQVVIKSKIPVFPSVDLFVRSAPLDSMKQPIRVKAWTSDVEVTFPASLVIFAEVKKEYTPVINAKVVATVTRPNGSLVDVELRDNGATPDMYKNDGIYSGYFTSITGSGRYGVIATVINDGQAALKMEENVISRSRFARDVDDNDNSLEEFERVADGGVFKVEKFQNVMTDIIPPSRVMDLEITEKIHFGFKDFIVSLQWTSPGDDYNTGNASFLELRFSDDMSKLRTSFYDCLLINQSDILNGELSPLPTGEIQSLTVRVSNLTELFDQPVDILNVTALYFSLVVLDEVSNAGDPSNIVYAFFEKELTRESNKRNDSATTEFLQISIFVFCSAIFIIIIVLILWKLKQKKKFMPKYEGVTTYKPPVPV